MSHLFGIGTRRQTKHWEQNFEFWPMAGENRAGRPGCPGEPTKNLEFRHFVLEGPQLKSAFGHFLFYARPPNSQLLFREPKNAPLFMDDDKPVWPRGCIQSKS